MLRRCAGLPLAIIVLAGLLSKIATVGEWKAVHENVALYIRRGTDLDQAYKGQKYGGALWVLALSYENLPYRLKLCFLYLSHYPEDYEISVKQLTYLWVAEGFISSKSSEISEDVAYSCLSELVERCMVQVGRIGLTGKIKTCRLHDLIRDLCMLKAEEENFFHVDFSTWNGINTTQLGRVRRLAVSVDLHGDQLVPTTRGTHLRSLLYFSPIYFTQPWKKNVIRSVFNDFKLLRVLKFEHMGGVKKLPSTVGNLIHLRFLSLKRSGVRNLPSSVANLVCLQTLDLRVKSFDKYPIRMRIPNVFKKMERLRNLYLPECYTVRGKLSFRNLQTLVNVDSRSFDLNAIVELSNLRKLYIRVHSRILKRLDEVLNSRRGPSFHHLRSLSVEIYADEWAVLLRNRFRSIHKLQLGGIMELPEDLMSFPNLIKLKLLCTKLKGDQIETLEKLPHLRVLHLHTEVFASLPLNTLVCTNGGFLKLELLYLEGLTELKEWRVEQGAMPSLQKLCIVYCKELMAVPDGLQYVATLEELTVEGMPSEFCCRLGEEGEDYHKIKHVHSLIINS